MKQSLFIEIICSLLVLLFVYTALSKFFDLGSFKAVLHTAPLIHSEADMLSWFLPLIELFVAACLLLPITRVIGLWGAALMLVIFTGYLIVMVYYNSKLPCSCGGVLRQLSWKEHILFNIFFIGLSATALWLKR